MVVRLAALALFAGALLSWAAIVSLDQSFVYFPSRQLAATPRSVGLAFDDVRFGEDDRLHGWFVPGTGPLTLLWFHGNAGNISHRVEWIRQLRDALGANVFIFDYSGYGQSRGQPSEASTYQDARAALAYLRGRPDVNPDRIVYFGKSLGGAVAIDLALDEPPYRLVVQSTFTSILDLGRAHYPFLPVGILIRSRYPSLEKIGRVRAPVLIVQGDRDEIVPLEQARQLYDAAAEPKRLYLVEGAGHNEVLPLGGRRYLEVLREFFAGEGEKLRS